MAIQLHHVNVTVPSELEAETKDFYGAVLGLEQVPKPAAARQSGAWYQIGDNQLHLSVEDEETGPLSSRHICFAVPDLGAAEQRFRDAGVEIIPDPRPIPSVQRLCARSGRESTRDRATSLRVTLWSSGPLCLCGEERSITTETRRPTEVHREKNQMSLKVINPESLGAPHGYSNGVLSNTGGRLLFIAGQIAWDQQQQIVSADMVEQFDRALANVLAVVTGAGGKPDQIARLMIYVTDKNEYRERMKEIGERYRSHMGKHFPAMVLVEVAGLLEDRAKIEIEGIAVL